MRLLPLLQRHFTRLSRLLALETTPYPPMAWLPALAFAIACVVMPASLMAQRWVCVPPTVCSTGGRSTPDAFALRLEHSPNKPAANTKVRVVSTGGNVHIVGATPLAGSTGLEVRTTDSGMVYGLVTNPTPSQTVLFIAEFPNQPYAEQTLTFGEVSPPIHAAPRAYYWYAGSQIRDVRVSAKSLDVAACEKSTVRFSPRGGAGSVSADTVYGVHNGDVCVFRTDWRLGDAIGRQVLHARLGAGTPVSIEAIARRRSGVRVALAGAVRRGGVHTINRTELKKLKVSRETADGLLLEYDSVIYSARSIDKSRREGEALPLILFETALRPKLERVRISIGASPLNIKRDFFAGASLGQLRWKTQPEDVGFDIQGGFLLSRPQRLENPALCEQHLNSDETRDANCKTTSKLRLNGIVASVSADTQALLGVVSKMLGLP